MKPLLLCTVGIPGSGKNHLLTKLQAHFDLKIVEPDDIRRTVLGSVNEQSDGKRVFDIAAQRIKTNLAKGNKVFFNATNVSWSRLKKGIEEYTQNHKCPVIIIFMEDSCNLKLCKSRVKKDLDDNVDRSNVPDDVIENMHKRYLQCEINAYNDEELDDHIELFLYHDLYFTKLVNLIEEKDE